VLLATIVLAALTAVLLVARPLSTRQAKPRPNLELRVADQDNRLRVDWDATNPAVLTAQGGTLEVEDGGTFNRYPVDPEILRKGGLDYVRRSDDVLLTLTLYHDGRPDLQASVRRIAPIGPEVAQTPPPESQTSRGRQR
jgi:hypothetical protein